MTIWKQNPPFHAVVLKDDGNLIHFPERNTIEEVFVDLKSIKYQGKDFIHNKNGASVYPHTVEPPPLPRKQK